MSLRLITTSQKHIINKCCNGHASSASSTVCLSVIGTFLKGNRMFAGAISLIAHVAIAVISTVNHFRRS